jgi:hypothetical protein
MSETVLLWIFGTLQGLNMILLGFLANWFHSHTEECKEWRGIVMEKVGNAEGRFDSMETK